MSHLPHGRMVCAIWESDDGMTQTIVIGEGETEESVLEAMAETLKIVENSEPLKGKAA